ncbi:MAG: GGDEF domain-containing protein, partial [Candidatus Thiodiazotropha sp.]
MTLRGSANAKRSLLMLALSIALIMLLSILWDDDILEHAEVSSQLIELKELGGRLDRDTLRVTSFLLADYDSLVETTHRLHELEVEMRRPGLSKYETLDDAIESYWQAMDEKLDTLERIKFQAAVVRNGILYLPLAANSVKEIDAGTFSQVLELLNQLYIFDLFYSDSQLAWIGQTVNRLERIQYADVSEQKLLDNILFHIKANLGDLSKLGELKRHYLGIPTLERFDALHNRYELHRVDETRKKQIMILFLSVSVIALVTGLWYLIRSLQRANLAVNRSWSRLHDAVENLSEAFALFDEQDRLVLFNHRYSEFYPWLGKWLQEGVKMRTLKSATGNRIQYLEMDGTPLLQDCLQ